MRSRRISSSIPRPIPPSTAPKTSPSSRSASTPRRPRRAVPMIHVSTDYVFDGSGTEPWSEGGAPRPLSVYGASKLAGDQAIAAAAPTHLIVRTSWV